MRWGLEGKVQGSGWVELWEGHVEEREFCCQGILLFYLTTCPILPFHPVSIRVSLQISPNPSSAGRLSVQPLSLPDTTTTMYIPKYPPKKLALYESRVINNVSHPNARQQSSPKSVKNKVAKSKRRRKLSMLRGEYVQECKCQRLVVVVGVFRRNQSWPHTCPAFLGLRARIVKV